MIHTGLLLRLALPAALALLVPHGPALADDPVIDVDKDDPQMRAAIAEARRGLNGFLAVVAAPPPGVSDLGFKYPLEGWEHIWVDVVERKGQRLVGTLANDPHSPGFELGQRVEVPLSAISDWAWRDAAGVVHGHFTTRVLLGRLPPEDAAQLRSILGWTD